MMRSKIPSKITAAKFYSMSLESFSAVSEQVFSFFFSLLFKLDQILEIETVYLIISLRGRERFFPSCRLIYAFSPGSKHVVLVLHGAHSDQKRVAAPNCSTQFYTIRIDGVSRWLNLQEENICTLVRSTSLKISRETKCRAWNVVACS